MISKDKTYRTRDGREVRIYATDGAGTGIIHGAIYHKSTGWWATTWTNVGVSFTSKDYDLIEVKPRHKRTFWFNMYGVGTVPEAFSSKARADRAAGCNRIACIERELDFEEGEGL